jgi:hypothetical protein
MKMVMIVVEQARREKVEAVLAERGVSGYSEIPTVYGAGSTGLRFGSRAFPGASSIILSVVEDGEAEPLLGAIDASCADCRAAMHYVVWGVEKMV